MIRRSNLLLCLVIIACVLLAISCSEGKDPTTPSELTSVCQTRTYVYGFWKLYPTPDTITTEVVPIRSSQFDVTEWADIKVTNAEWDPVLRNWTVTVEVSNPTQFSGWGVRAVFTDLGGKEIRNPDGYVWMDLDGSPGDERYPFFAIEKETEGRIFEGLHTSTRDMTFHFPNGVDKWLPMSFFVDANIGGPRPDPMVEDLEMAHFPPPCQHATVTAFVDDHQSALDELEVWVDLETAGGNPVEPMYDDGEHGDGLAGDGIYGAEFTDGNFGEFYTFTVYARDPEGNTGENDIQYSPISYPPLPPIMFENLFNDQFCLINEERLEVIGDQASWETFWEEFSPWDMSAPVLDFDNVNVIAVCLGERPDDCYKVEITGVDWSSVNCGWSVKYTETVPGAKCECGDVVTTPFHIVTVNKSAFKIMFEGEIYVDDCTDPSDPCLDLIELMSSPYGKQPLKTTSVIVDQTSWEQWWGESAGSTTAPEVDFETDMVIAVTQGVQNTSGYFATVDSACVDDTDMLEIMVGWHIPGPTCMVLQVITWPYAAYKAKKTEFPYYWTTYDDVYDCD